MTSCKCMTSKMLNVSVAGEQQFWLDPEENAYRWYENNTESFGAMERQTLIAHLMGNA